MAKDDENEVIAAVAAEIEALTLIDALEAQHRADSLQWLAETTDVFRRVSHPVAPVRHLVAYFLIVDTVTDTILLGDHIKANRWLPSGGHVEPGEHPVSTVERECVEELGVRAAFHSSTGPHPVFLTISDTVGSADIHNDVSLWYVLELSEDTVLDVDRNEYRSVRWWSRDEVTASDPLQFEPHLPRMLSKLSLLCGQAKK